MKITRYATVLILGAILTALANGQGMAITQIDTSGLLAGQTVRLYLSAPQSGFQGDALPDLEVWESGADKKYDQRPIKAIARNTNAQEGISFFFLIDNSGSMWTALDGGKAAAPGDERIAHAKAAARAFLSEVSRKDKVGLAVFNTRYWKAADPTQDIERIDRSLDELRKPGSDEAYTELYLSLDQALAEFAQVPGRRALVVLSDGENFPYYGRTGKPNPATGVRTASPDEVIERANREGITVYAVRFGDEKDPSLGSIAQGSGGKIFDASNEEELAAVYTTIRDDVLREITVDYRAGMDFGSKHFVKAVLRDSSGKEYNSERYYYSGTVLGWNEGLPRWYYLLFLLVPALLWIGLLFFKLERQTSKAGLELLYGPGGRKTQVFALTSAQTVVGSSDAADITIAGNPSLKSQHATILFDKAQNVYTVVGDSNLTVNNREVKSKRLEPGDVINMAGTVVVFDDAPDKGAKRKPKGKR